MCVSRLCEGGRLSPGSRHSLNNKSMSAESPEAHAHPEPKHTCQDPTPGQTNKAQAHTDRQTQKLENMYLEIKTMPLQLK